MSHHRTATALLLEKTAETVEKEARNIIDTVNLADIESRVENTIMKMLDSDNPMAFLLERTQVVFAYPEDLCQTHVAVGFMLNDLTPEEIERLNIESSAFYPTLSDSPHIVAWTDIMLDELHVKCTSPEVFEQYLKDCMINQLYLPEWFIENYFQIGMDEDNGVTTLIKTAFLESIGGAIECDMFPQSSRLMSNWLTDGTAYRSALLNCASRIFLEAEADKYILSASGIAHKEFPGSSIIVYPEAIGSHVHALSALSLSFAGNYHESVLQGITDRMQFALGRRARALEDTLRDIR